jgi:Hydrogenase maturation factor
MFVEQGLKKQGFVVHKPPAMFLGDTGLSLGQAVIANVSGNTGKNRKIKGKTAVASVGGIEREIGIELTPGVKIGEYVLLHAGFAIERISRKRR